MTDRRLRPRQAAYRGSDPYDDDPGYRRPTSTAGRIALVLFATLAALGGLGAIAVVGAYAALATGLPDPNALETIRFAEESIVYDRTGKMELARFGEFRREVATWAELEDAAVLVDATTAVEDKTFWTNPGFDPAAIVASGIDALRGNARGGSTITQQLVRQRLLEDDLVQDPDRTVERKLKEIIQSIRLTQTYPGEEGKQAVITAYLNQNFYGNDSYGVKAAARSYFNKALSELTLAEAAIIAALPQSPSEYDLVRNAIEECTTAVPDDAECPESRLLVPEDTAIVQRRNLVLELMSQDRTPLTRGTYDADAFEAAMDEPVLLAPQQEPRWQAPHFIWSLREELAVRICGEGAPTCPKLEEGGFRITSTLDTRLQGVAEKWVKAAAIVPRASSPRRAAERLGLEFEPWMDNLRDKEIRNGALVALDYQTGELVAYVGSADYYAARSSRRFQPKFDVVADGYRQPGSAFKPFVYVTGIDQRSFGAGTMFMDVATDFGGGYTPSDADNLERGPVRVTDALRFSLNIPAVKAGAVAGTAQVYERAKAMGLRFRAEVPDTGLALPLGVEEVRPVDLVTGYGTIANAGRYLGHTTILAITDPTGAETIPPYEPPPGTQVVSPEAAGVVTNILAGNTNPQVNPFWGEFAIAGGGEAGRRPATLKTGTNNDARDLNAYGYIAPPSAEGRAAGEYALVAGAWNGNSDNSVVSTPQNPVFSIDVTTFVWQGFVREATSGWQVNDFALPETVQRIEVDPFTGLLPGPRGRTVTELFLPGEAPAGRVGAEGGACGETILQAYEHETRFENWLAADRDWLRRARRGPGTAGGPDRTRTTYFYNGGFAPYGRSWGPLLGGGACATPRPSTSCVPIPTADPSGVIPSFVLPSPTGSEPALVPCPPASPSVPPSLSPTPTPTEEPTPTPTEEPTPTPTEEPTPTPTEEPPPSAGGEEPTPAP